MKNCMDGRFIAVVVSAGFAAGCGASPSDITPNTSSSYNGLMQEVPGENAPSINVMGQLDTNCLPSSSNSWCGYLDDAAVTRTSYAAGDYKGCSGSLIGPNILLTAAHCVPTDEPEKDFNFTLIQSADLDFGNREFQLPCRYLINVSQRSQDPNHLGGVDTALAYCPNVLFDHDGDGQTTEKSLPPGEIFGYLDFDFRLASIGQAVYHNGRNPLATRSNRNFVFFIPGDVIENDSPHGFQTARDYCYNQFSIPGFSGSAHISKDWNRIIGGPLNQWYDLQCEDQTNSSGVRAIDIFTDGYIDTDTYPDDLNSNYIDNGPWGLDSSIYMGSQAFIDSDGDKLLDVQYDIEQAEGEAPARSLIWLGFESRRRNALWSSRSGAKFYPDHINIPDPPFGIAHVDSTFATGFSGPEVLVHEKIDPAMLTTYRFSMKLNALAGHDPMTTYYLDAVTGSTKNTYVLGNTVAGTKIQLTADIVFPLQLGNPSHELVIWTNGPTKADMLNPVLVKEGDILHLNLANERDTWRAQEGDYAFFLPEGTGAAAIGNGQNVSAHPDWALAVKPGDDPMGYPDASNSALAFVENETYSEVCFDAKFLRGTIANFEAKIGELGQPDLVSATFTANGVWTNFCLTEFTAIQFTNLQFELGELELAVDEALLIDNIEIKK